MHNRIICMSELHACQKYMHELRIFMHVLYIIYASMWIPKGAALIRGRHLFEARRLLEEIRHIRMSEIHAY